MILQLSGIGRDMRYYVYGVENNQFSFLWFSGEPRETTRFITGRLDVVPSAQPSAQPLSIFSQEDLSTENRGKIPLDQKNAKSINLVLVAYFPYSDNIQHSHATS